MRRRGRRYGNERYGGVGCLRLWGHGDGGGDVDAL